MKGRALASIRHAPPGPVLNDENAPGFVDTVMRLATLEAAAENELWSVVDRLAASGKVDDIRRIAALRRQLAATDALARLDSRPGPRPA